MLSQIEASSCRLFNPLEAVRWNIDKHYLIDLEIWGIPIVPTYLASVIDPVVLQDMFGKRKWRNAILKPTIGAGGDNSYRIPPTEIDATLRKLSARKLGLEYLVQPFIESVKTEGEWSFAYFNRKLSHALIKKPAPNDYRVQGIYGGTVETAEPQTHDLLQAETLIAKLPFNPLYARFDLVRVDGHLSVMRSSLLNLSSLSTFFQKALCVLSTPPGSLLESGNNAGMLCGYTSI